MRSVTAATYESSASGSRTAIRPSAARETADQIEVDLSVEKGLWQAHTKLESTISKHAPILAIAWLRSSPHLGRRCGVGSRIGYRRAEERL
jgi:hypothetical protein